MAWSKVSRHLRGYGSEWSKLRLQILERDSYLCQTCMRANRVTPANTVDHIKPKAQKGTDDPINLESICDPCHKVKTAKETGKTIKIKTETGLDGWPKG